MGSVILPFLFMKQKEYEKKYVAILISGLIYQFILCILVLVMYEIDKWYIALFLIIAGNGLIGERNYRRVKKLDDNL